MKILHFLFGTARSLRRGLIVNIFTSLSLSILLVGAVVIHEFYEHSEDELKDTLIREAKEVIGQIDPDAPHFGLDGGALRFRGIEGAFRYTVFDNSGQAVAGGENPSGMWAQLQAIKLGKANTVTVLGEREGIGMHARIKDQDVFVLVTTFPTSNNQTRLQKVLHEAEEQTGWVILGVIMVLMAAVLATRRALIPLDRLSGEAAKISPTDASQRLITDDVPDEFTPLINAVNEAFDRLEAGYRAQRDFSSNAAHEIRTPLAVLRSSIDRIEDGDLKDSLAQDVMQLDQMFQQLIDLARADGVVKSSFDSVDLQELAVDVARDMAQAALRDSKTLSVVGAENTKVNGSAGLLNIALHNLVRNALQYAPSGHDVEIEILCNPAGWRVLDRGPGVPDDLKPVLFDRFNRGAQMHSKTKGSGIGLSIVKSVAESHGATVLIQDRKGGGSIFSFIFNK